MTEFAPDFLETFGPVIWAEFDDPVTLAVKAFAQVDVNDPPTYYHGFKEGTILSVDRVTRGLSSDDDGTNEAQSFSITFSDVNRYWRGILGRTDLARIIINKTLKLRMISNTGRLAGDTPRTVALGLVRSYTTE